MKRKSFLILTASIGSGHTKAAQAIKEALLKQQPSDIVNIVDWSDKRVSPANWLTKKLYLKMLAFVPNLYDVFYKLSANGLGGAMAQQTNERLMYRTMQRVLSEFSPDAVICTHPFPAGAAAAVKRRGGKFLSATVLTDYTLHKMWVYNETDIFFTATEQMRSELIQMGFAPNRLVASGIPIREAFMAQDTKENVRGKMGIADEEKVILLMGGGLGLGGIENTVAALERIEQQLTMFVIAGRNERLKERMLKKADTSAHTLRVLGYIKDIAPYMRAADLIITKPGALTVSESFALGLPMILHEPIPGPETQNARHAVDNGAALWAGKDIERVVGETIADASRLQAMQKAALELSRPNAAAEIAEKLRREIVRYR